MNTNNTIKDLPSRLTNMIEKPMITAQTLEPVTDSVAKVVDVVAKSGNTLTPSTKPTCVKNPTSIKLEELLYKMEHIVAADGSMFYCLSDSREGINYYSVPAPNEGDSPYEAIYQHVCLNWDIEEYYTLAYIDHISHEGGCITFGNDRSEMLTFSTEEGAREFLEFLRSKFMEK